MTSPQTDCGALDRPEILYRLFHPRREPRGFCPPGTEDLLIPVEAGEHLGARFHPCGDASPTLLFFHGNGEIARDYDDLGPAFVRAGLHFLIVDYRGYGRSTGRPTASRLLTDCRAVLTFVRRWLLGRGYSGPLIAAGRSLGSASALELAAHHGQPAIAGLVVESGFAETMPLLETLGCGWRSLGLTEEQGFLNLEKIRAYSGPTLIIHGARDTLIPASNAHALFEASGAKDKKLLVVPEADHNSVFLYGLEDYVAAVADLADKARATLVAPAPPSEPEGP